MGIFGLLKFVSLDCENGYEKVYLEDIARQYKNETGKDPVMLADASSCVRFLATKETVYPITLKNFQKNLEIFINKCSQMGIRIKFVGDGLKPREKYKTWISRTLQKFTEENDLYTNFLVGPLMRTAEIIYQKSDKCDFVRSIYEADDYITRYAKTEGCFAIMSNDSDLLIVEGSFYFLSPVTLDLKNMTTHNYNRESLAKSLGLRPTLLPVFASLCDCQISGNEYKSKRDKVVNNPRIISEQFQDLANIIKECPFSEGDYHEILNHITEKMAPEKANKVKYQFRSFTGAEEKGSPILENDHWSEILRAAQRRHVTGVSEKHLLDQLMERVAFLAPKYNARMEFNIVHKLRSLREKIYGILFFECPDDEVYVKEYTFVGEKKNPEPKEQEVRFARRSHSGLLQLWSEDRSEEMMYKRRRLFCETLDEKLTPAMLDELDIPDELLFLVLALFYIRRHGNSENPDIERKILLTQAVLTQKAHNRGITSHRRYRIAPVEIEMADSFVTTIEHLELLNSVCGEPFSTVKTGLINYYDGDTFHFVYENVVKGKLIPKFINLETSAEFYGLKEKLEKLESTCGGAGRDVVELASMMAAG